MACARKPIVTITTASVAVLAFSVAVWMLPGMVQRLTYAAESQPAVWRGREASPDFGMTVQTLTAGVARQIGDEELEQGVVVTGVEPGSVAARAGVQPGDVILGVGDTRVKSDTDFREAMERLDVSRGIGMQMMREGRQMYVFFHGDQ